MNKKQKQEYIKNEQYFAHIKYIQFVNKLIIVNNKMSQHVPALSYKQLKTGQRVYYSLVEKQSQNKVFFNQRLLILVQQRYIGYTKEYNKKDLQSSIDLSKLKKKIPLNDIRRILNINKQVTIMINQYDKFNKLKSTKWLFKMNNEKLAEDWTSILERQNSPSPSRKTTQHHRPDDQKSLANQNSPSVKSLFKQAQQNLRKQQTNNSKIRLNNTASQKLLSQRQISKQKQLKILKYIQVQQQKQKLERQKQRLRQLEIEKQKQKQRLKQIQKQKEKQREKQKEKEVLKYFQSQKKQKQKQAMKQKLKRPETVQPKFYLPNQLQRYEDMTYANQHGTRFSNRTFTFKQSTQQQNYSPPKRQARVNYPNSNANTLGHNSLTQKNKILDQKLSQKLQQKVNKKMVQKQLKMTKDKTHKYSEYQFRQLGEVLTNRQKQIDNKNYTNYFKETFYNIDDHRFQDFYSLIEMKIQQLLLQNLQNKQALQAWIQQIENKNGINIKILPTELKQIPGNANICDEGQLKLYLTKAKNMDYIWRIISQDEVLSQIFLMPMTCIAQFQGMVAFFTCLCEVETDEGQKPQDYSKYFDLLCKKTKISKSIIQNPSCIRFTKHGDKFIISQINELLPKITSINCTIRPQMFMQISEQIPAIQSPFKKNRDNSFNNSRLIKKEQQQQNKYFKQPISQTINVISRNLDKLQEYVVHPSEFSHLMHLYGLNIVYIHQIYKQIQNNYIKNILKTEVALRSFKVIYRKRIQQMLMTPQKKKQKSKNIYIVQNQQIQDKNRQNYNKKPYLQRLHETTKTLINIFLSNMQQSNQLWNIVTLHSQINFKLPVERGEINKGYFFLGLEHHLGLKLSTIYSSCERIFTVDEFIDDVQFVAKIKPCQLYWIDDSIYNLPLNEAADTLLVELELHEKQIPFYIYQNKNVLEKIYEILSLYHSPQSANIKHLHIFKDCHQNSQKTLFYFRRKLSQIKWFIKTENQQLSSLSLILQAIQQKLIDLKESLIFYFGNYHPFYTQIYDILISIHEKQYQFEKAQQYSKLAMSNMIQLCGGNTMHIKLANNYYQKGQLYQNWGKIEQAIASYKKSKNILEYNQYLNSKQYAMVELRLSLLYLNKFKDNDSFRLLYNSLRIFCRICKIQLKNSNINTQQESNIKNVETNRINNKTNTKLSKQQEQNEPEISSSEQLQVYSNISLCLQLINRCITAQSLDRTSILIKQTLFILRNCLDPQYPMIQVQFPDQLTAKLIKVMVQNYFIQHKRSINQQFLSFVELVCDNLHNGKTLNAHQNNDFNGSIDVLKKFIINQVFMENLDGFNNKSKVWIQQMSLNKKVNNLNKNGKNAKNKDIQKFEMLMQAIIVVLGQSFIFGILNDKSI